MLKKDGGKEEEKKIHCVVGFKKNGYIGGDCSAFILFSSLSLYRGIIILYYILYKYFVFKVLDECDHGEIKYIRGCFEYLIVP